MVSSCDLLATSAAELGRERILLPDGAGFACRRSFADNNLQTFGQIPAFDFRYHSVCQSNVDMDRLDKPSLLHPERSPRLEGVGIAAPLIAARSQWSPLDRRFPFAVRRDLAWQR